MIKDVAGIVFAGKIVVPRSLPTDSQYHLLGANHTTVAALESFFAAMLLFPEVQKKAQEELDRVLQGRLPEFQDEPNLPYISAIVKEVLR